MRQRTGVAQSVRSTAQITRRSVARVHPPVLEWGKRLGLPECPYVRRWKLEIPHLGSVRVHHWTGRDDDRAHHDHPWWFLTFVIKGAYEDCSPGEPGEPGRIEWLSAPAVRFRRAEHRHYVVPQKEAWTILVTGPKTRSWGFWQGGKFRKSNKWFASQGHHPCS